MAMRYVPKPEYTVTVFVNNQVVGEFMESIPDPFVNTSVTIPFRDLVRAALRHRQIKVNVVVSGSADAYAHVMNVRPYAVETGPVGFVPTDYAG